MCSILAGLILLIDFIVPITHPSLSCVYMYRSEFKGFTLHSRLLGQAARVSEPLCRSRYVTAEFPREFPQAMPGLALVWNRLCMEG